MKQIEQDIADGLKELQNSAEAIGSLKVSESFDDELPWDVQCGLIRLAAAIGLAIRLKDYEAHFDENTPEEVGEAYTVTQEAVECAERDAYENVREYVDEMGELGERVEVLSLDSPSKSLTDNLLKLYRCEYFIQTSEICYKEASFHKGGSVRLPLYEPNDYEGRNFGLEYNILRMTGVDVERLFEIMAGLIKLIQAEMADYETKLSEQP